MRHKLKTSPLAPRRAGITKAIEGVRLATAKAGIKYADRKDVLLVEFDPETSVGGAFTTSRCAGAPVLWSRNNLPAGTARALVVNSGNANAFTGRRGTNACAEISSSAARALHCAAHEVFLASTGVIGEPIDVSKFEAVFPNLVSDLAPGGFEQAAEAIMTTDTFAKAASATVVIDGVPIEFAGIAKGSGMIAPDMATTLAFVFTDAAIAPDVLQSMVSRAIQTTFNAITVDADTSTSDTFLVFATGKARIRGAIEITREDDAGAQEFYSELSKLMLDLALQVVRDGEGARKFITVSVTGASSVASARKIAFTVANSPLVKTAVAGEDANWGRVAMAIGKSGEDFDQNRVSIAFGEYVLARDGMRADDYNEGSVTEYMRRPDIDILIDVGAGNGSDKVYTCDLTSDYVVINGDYRS